MRLHVSAWIGTALTAVKSQRSSDNNIIPFASVQGSRLLKEISHHWPSEMCTVHRNRTLTRRYIRNVYSARKPNTLQTVHKKYVLCTQTEHIACGT